MMSVDEVALAPWQRHNVRLGASALMTLAAAVALWIASPSPDGRDPFYAAIAIEFVIWGALNLLFAVGGVRGVAKLRAGDPSSRPTVVVAKARSIVRALRFNRWLNVVWNLTGVGLLIWGYRAWSPGLVGHGAGVLSQAIVLTLLDGVFGRELRKAVRAIDAVP